jgi:hypothetical protein
MSGLMLKRIQLKIKKKVLSLSVLMVGVIWIG